MVFGITTKLLKAVRAVGSSKEVDAAIGLEGFVTMKHEPTGIEARRHVKIVVRKPSLASVLDVERGRRATHGQLATTARFE